ncbi:MAG TPA: SGNH/GDSL hydrolase family protein [Rhizomicrobium sp.]|nr:SGNH/GDSL hydrolase family protein [Rhizomicrobium sp.]
MAAGMASAKPAKTARRPASPPAHWVGSWAASQQIPEDRNTLPPDALRDATLRQTVHLSIGGKTLRVVLSNAFGTAPLHLMGAHIARPGAALGSIDPATDRALTFSGRADVTIPAGADMLSDPIAFDAPALSDLAITLHYDAPPARQTSHPGARATSFYLSGDHVTDATLTGATAIAHWFQIEEVDVLGTAPAIVALGDSLTDGHGATTDGNDRWTDALARRLQAAHLGIAVLNKGIGGGRLLEDGLGPSALARFDRDVLAPPGVKWLILLEGINDLGVLTQEKPATEAEHAALVARVEAAYEQIVARAHAHGIKVYGATLMPWIGFDYYHPDAQNEADRQAVNAWLRAPRRFDALIDFDAVLRDTANPAILSPLHDSGDHLHPGPKGYQAMADAVPLTLFAPHRKARK